MKIFSLTQGQTREVKALSLEQILGASRSGSSLGVVSAYQASVWAYRCINLRAQAVSSVPLKIVRAKSKEDLPDHPLQKLWGEQASRLLWRLEAALCIWGRAYIEPVRNRLGQVVELRWLNPAATQTQVGAGGITGFYHTPSTGQGVLFKPEELAYLYYFHPGDDLSGYSPLMASLAAVGIDQDTRRYSQAFFSNGARLDGILTIPEATDDQVDLVESKWQAVFRGVRNAFKTMVIGGREVSYTPIAAPPKDTALSELRAEQRRDICAAFGVPPALAGAWESANYASAAESRKSFYTETILPELDFIEDELNRQLVQPLWPEAALKFDLSQIEALREDEKTRNEAISLAYQAGWLTLNEARERAGMGKKTIKDCLLPAAAAEVAAEEKFFRSTDWAEYP
jgi:HK97 family phage portal protein